MPVDAADNADSEETVPERGDESGALLPPSIGVEAAELPLPLLFDAAREVDCSMAKFSLCMNRSTTCNLAPSLSCISASVDHTARIV
jgi:hypothetical protein